MIVQVLLSLLYAEGPERMAPSTLPEGLSAETLVLERAIEVFGDRNRANEWMHEPNPALGNEAPLTSIATEDGCRAVIDILGRIEHGVIS